MSGEKVAEIPLVLANHDTRFNPTCICWVAYGVLDLPDFDWLLGAGFLQKCSSHAIVKQQDHKLVTFTPARSSDVVIMDSEWGAIGGGGVPLGPCSFRR